MKYIHLVLALLFLSFAIVQWNDPDSILWILLYLLVSVIAFMAFRGRHIYLLNLALGLLLLICVLFYIPDIISWFRDGMPSITDSMKASSPYIELIREFFGLFISLITVSFYIAVAKKQKS